MSRCRRGCATSWARAPSCASSRACSCSRPLAGRRAGVLGRLSADAAAQRTASVARAAMEPSPSPLLLTRVRVRALPGAPAARAQRRGERVGRGESPPPLPESGPSEIANLNRGFNRMLTEPAAARRGPRAAARRRLARPAHAARAAAPRRRDGHARRRCARGMVDDIEEMDKIIGQFLDFARDDDDAAREPSPLDAIVARCVERYARPARDVRFAPARLPRVPVRADRDVASVTQPRRQRAALRRAAGRGHHARAGRRVVLEVADRGPGIAPERRRAAEAAVHARATRAARATAPRAPDLGPRDRRAHRAHCTAAASTCAARGRRHDRARHAASGRAARSYACALRRVWLGTTQQHAASAAMPSPRPVKPRRSVVVAFTLTSTASQPRSAAMLARIAGTCGASFGACATIVASTLPTRSPRSASATRGAAARGCRRPVHRGSLSGKCAPDVAQRQRAEDRVADRVQQHVGVGVAGEAALDTES